MLSAQPMPDAQRADSVVDEVLRRFSVRPAAFQHLTAALEPSPQTTPTALVEGLRAVCPQSPANSEFWRHAELTGFVAAVIAESNATPPSPLAALAGGLVHNIGWLALASCFPKGAARVARMLRERDLDRLAAEHEVFAVNHTRVGKRLAEASNWPEPIVSAIWLHHQPAPILADRPALVRIVGLAQALAQWKLHARGGPVLDPSSFELARSMGLSLDDCVAILERAEREVAAATAPGSEIEAPPAPSAGPPWSEKLAHLVDHFSCSAPSEPAVARELAEAAADVFELDQVMAFAATAAPGRLALHLLSMTEQPAPLALRELDDAALQRLGAAAESGGYVGLVPFDIAAVEELFRRKFETAPRFIPVVSEGRLCGGVLVPADCESMILRASSVQERRALSQVCGMRIRLAQVTAQARRLEEEWVELGRVQTEVPLPHAPLHSMAQMAAGAAHELNNPLAVIAGRAQLLRSAATDEALARHVDIIEQQAHRASDLVSELMDFAKPAPPIPKTIQLGAWVESLQQHWQARSALAPQQIEVRISDPNLSMHVDPAQLTVAADAIIANAIEASDPKKAHLVVNSESTATDDTIVVSFGDNGRGMSPKVLASALDPFFSARPAGRGRGLGLSRAARLLEVNGGRLWIESQPNQGATVFVAVPAVKR